MADQSQKKFAPPERIRPKTLVATSLTAATVALISTRLTNTVSSITLVAIASMLTAFISEAYRMLLESFHKAVRKQVDRLVTKSHLEVNDSTGELHIVEELDALEGASGDAANPADSGINGRFKHLLNSRYGMAAWFAVIGLATVAAVFFIGSATADKDFTIQQEVVQTRDISQKTQAEIEKNAQENAESQASTAQQNAEANSKQLVQLTKSQLIQLITALEGETSDLSQRNEAQDTKIKNLQQQITAISKELKQREETAPSPNPSPSVPSPSAAPSSPVAPTSPTS